jgi:hypothetical protein
MNKLAQEYLIKRSGIGPARKAIRRVFKSELGREAILGGLAGGVATGVMMPVDTISDTQKQWRNTRGEPELNRTSRSFLATAKELAHPKIRENTQGGPSPFYAGAAGKFMKTIPYGAVMFAAKHKLLNTVKKI